ncbi:MAG TPA: glycoside hydrolase family 16 protein [Kofleriaceae bacterium]
MILIGLAICTLAATQARAATSGFTITSSSSVQFWVNDAPWADLHYQINGGVQYDVTAVPGGATVRYFFTIGSSTGGATDTAWSQFTMTAGGSGNYVVVWEDTFDGSGQPSTANWNYHVGNGFNPGAQAFDGWGNGEWEWYRPEQSTRQNGNLVIRADYFSTPTVIAGRNWFQRSGRLTTKGKRSWTYGRIEARIAMPNATATWPAFSMMGDAYDDTSTTNFNAPITQFDTMASNWSSCGEIDIMEHRNSETVTFQNPDCFRGPAGRPPSSRARSASVRSPSSISTRSSGSQRRSAGTSTARPIPIRSTRWTSPRPIRRSSTSHSTSS